MPDQSAGFADIVPELRRLMPGLRGTLEAKLGALRSRPRPETDTEMEADDNGEDRDDAPAKGQRPLSRRILGVWRAFDPQLPPNDALSCLELYDPDGVLVAIADNNAPDGRNAVLNYKATTAGTYRGAVIVRGRPDSTAARRTHPAIRRWFEPLFGVSPIQDPPLLIPSIMWA